MPDFMAVVKILVCETEDRAEPEVRNYVLLKKKTKRENVRGKNDVIKTFRALLKCFEI